MLSPNQQAGTMGSVMTMVRPGSSAGLSAPEARETPKKMAALSRRRHRRIDAQGRVFAQLGGGWEASVLNLSVGGMLLRLRRDLTPGSSYVVKLFLEEQIAIVEARVVRLSPAASEEQGEPECFAALQFTSVSASDATCLRGYVND
ncbi:MAG: hypothetical protein BMS9Abin37_2882 [Acidobacteriota bacterium]|nr:MAG: hypothetical protein BMS9Abin37_2882 [Acidobacteriota bacterium]